MSHQRKWNLAERGIQMLSIYVLTERMLEDIIVIKDHTETRYFRKRSTTPESVHLHLVTLMRDIEVALNTSGYEAKESLTTYLYICSHRRRKPKSRLATTYPN